MSRTSFLVDGFNLYHSLREAADALPGARTRWLELAALARANLYIVGNGASLESIHYFSALATHLEASKPGVTNRHRLYLAALEDAGVIVELGRFKARVTRCDACGAPLVRPEEKETDVAIATRLLEIFHAGRCETAVVVSGDTDLAPAVRTVQRLVPAARILFAFPYARKNRELARLAPGSFVIGREAYVRHQLPDPVITADGRRLHRPPAW
jgi:uncharacterized LabA/DUF88 family protein